MQSIDLHTITDDELFSVLQKLGIPPGPIVDTTRDFYKKKVYEKLNEFDEVDDGNTLNETTKSDHQSDRFALHKTSKHSTSSFVNHSPSRELENDIYTSKLSSPATETAKRLAMLQQSVSMRSELQHRVQNTGMSGRDKSYRQPIPFSGRVRSLTPGRSASFEKYWDEKILQKKHANDIAQGRVKIKAGNKIHLIIKIIGFIMLMLVMYYIWKGSEYSDSLLIDSDKNPTVEDDEYDFDSLLK